MRHTLAEVGKRNEAYWCGWADGRSGKAGSFVHNEELARWEEAHDRLDYYRGHRAGWESRPAQKEVA